MIVCTKHSFLAVRQRSSLSVTFLATADQERLTCTGRSDSCISSDTNFVHCGPLNTASLELDLLQFGDSCVLRGCRHPPSRPLRGTRRLLLNSLPFSTPLRGRRYCSFPIGNALRLDRGFHTRLIFSKLNGLILEFVELLTGATSATSNMILVEAGPVTHGKRTTTRVWRGTTQKKRAIDEG